MNQSDKEYIIYLEERITQLAGRYEQVKERELELYQEIQEFKNQNPFRIIEIAPKQVDSKDIQIDEVNENMKGKFKEIKERESKLRQKIAELKNQNPFTNMEVHDSELKDENMQELAYSFEDNSHSAKQYINNDDLFVNVLWDFIKDIVPTEDLSSNKSKGEQELYQIVVDIGANHSNEVSDLELKNINVYVQDCKENRGRKGFKANMNEEKEYSVEDLNFEHEEVFPKENSLAKSDYKLIEQLRKDIEEIKILLKEKKDPEVVEKVEEWVEDNFPVEEQQQSFSFRDIQNAQSIHSYPSKRPNTITNVRRKLDIHPKNDYPLSSPMKENIEQTKKLSQGKNAIKSDEENDSNKQE